MVTTTSQSSQSHKDSVSRLHNSATGSQAGARERTVTFQSQQPPPPPPPTLVGPHGKRLPAGEVDLARDHQQPPHKKPRTRLLPPGNIDLSTFSKPALPARHTDVPTSPLFFSHSQRPPMARPPSFSAGLEVAGTMLNHVRENTEVTTLKLARGTVSSASPARSSSTPGSWSSIDATAFGKSPDGQVALSSSSGISALQGIGILELLERDDRPTFIVDNHNPVPTLPGSSTILHYNPALLASYGLRNVVSGEGLNSPEAKAEFEGFSNWIKSAGVQPDGMDVFMPSFHYAGLDWTCATIRQRFRFVSANKSAASIARSSPAPPTGKDSSTEPRGRGLTPTAPPKTPSDVALGDTDYFGTVHSDARSTGSSAGPGSDIDEASLLREGVIESDSLPLGKPSFDWTRIPLTDDLPTHIRFARTRDWANTPLGPIEDWSHELRAMANMVMGSPHPAALYWGRDLTVIYNEAYIAMAGQKHPTLMGQRYQDAWQEIWPDIGPILESAWDSGQAIMKNDDRLLMSRYGFMEETFFSWSIVPLVGEDGSVVGLYNPAFENTRRKVAERRMLTLREIGERTALARDVKGFWNQVNKGLEYNEEDVPFALVYSVADDHDSDMSSMHSGSIQNPPQLALEASLGVPDGHRCLVTSVDLRTSNDGFAPYMRESMTRAGAPVRLSASDGTMPAELMAGFAWRGPGDPCQSIVIFPVHPTTGGDSVVGFIVMGVNPRRPFDEDYELFIHLLSRQLATSLASVVLFEEEIRRGQKAARLAALDRQELAQQLHLRTQEVEESELKFTRMAEFAPVGMFIANGGGHIVYCNDMWWEISRHPRSEDSVNTWMDSIRPEDRPALEAKWASLVSEKTAITQEFRFKCSRHDGDSVMDTWVLMSAYPERDANGEIKGIFGCITDISQQKFAEKIQAQRREEAVELKRQQENFIDITSHEMRNPLSAILQCADEISGTLSKYRGTEEAKQLTDTLRLAVDGSLEAANTITLCASHQKRIVDDILTLSKLDSQLLLVTPVDVQPMAVVKRVFKMFEGELNTNGIQMTFLAKNRFLDLGIDWVKLDPSRLLQVLINLLTNAIKFTQARPERSIVVTLDASQDISEVTKDGVEYFLSDRTNKEDLTEHPDWGDGEKINLHFSVQDTGRGLDEHERKLLFQRFSQATPRTHVQYGGSGLGLFISRILTELQGGQIDVTSQKGVGSTFSFYVKCRRSSKPPSESMTLPPAAPPLTRAPGSSTVIENHQPTSTGLISQALKRAPLIKPRIVDGQRMFDVLIVEDNVVNQRVLQRQLRNVGNNTKVANHGGEALAVLEKSRYWTGKEESGDDISVILMDLEMPIMDGMTCARKIRELERQGTIVSHIPIIAVTAYARPEQIEDAKAAGVDDVISKPFRMPELIPRIEELVSKYEAYTESTAAA
ncbi:uncharacterized protein B0I36DRAFT_247821 [Microdochium trichocladiopsis]|uniref:Uncharacterized protein n=1 Tax=Microdochium trichocladiopsis TaxID=1682393 RepID=A0A9P9BRY9_9PEZI|nr:uncharacterized protein B0I36DRAFT_247821 [Microdochium trichocladiopsis]KAH7027775.1 hypothetical protein B0I36DRAFT_247821 [Microdochium trichocladiopsis]